MSIKRFQTNPLIESSLSSVVGNNINGPSVIKVPDWVKKPLGKYYMYFAHHSGKNIRLAYTDELVGPWKIYEPGTLQIQNIPHFYDHIASPDVHIDNINQRIIMYFHGRVPGLPKQWTGVSTSKNGIYFEPKNNILGKFYFRVWYFDGFYYALAKNHNEGWGELYRSNNAFSNFESRGNFIKNMRHAAVKVEGSLLKIFYTRVGDAPERIMIVTVNMSYDWKVWTPSIPKEVMRPEMQYEGIEFPIKKSAHGSAIKVHELRDPCIFTENDETYLFYSCSGEMAICGAKIV